MSSCEISRRCHRRALPSLPCSSCFICGPDELISCLRSLRSSQHVLKSTRSQSISSHFKPFQAISSHFMSPKVGLLYSRDLLGHLPSGPANKIWNSVAPHTSSTYLTCRYAWYYHIEVISIYDIYHTDVNMIKAPIYMICACDMRVDHIHTHDTDAFHAIFQMSHFYAHRHLVA